MKFNDFDFFKSLKGLLCFICGKLKGESCQKGEEAKNYKNKLQSITSTTTIFLLSKMLQNLDKIFNEELFYQRTFINM